jgi:hypothetical protein
MENPARDGARCAIPAEPPALGVHESRTGWRRESQKKGNPPKNEKTKPRSHLESTKSPKNKPKKQSQSEPIWRRMDLGAREEPQKGTPPTPQKMEKQSHQALHNQQTSQKTKPKQSQNWANFDDTCTLGSRGKSFRMSKAFVTGRSKRKLNHSAAPGSHPQGSGLVKSFGGVNEAPGMMTGVTPVS